MIDSCELSLRIARRPAGLLIARSARDTRRGGKRERERERRFLHEGNAS